MAIENRFATENLVQNALDDLASCVAFIDTENNETVTDVEISDGDITVDSTLSASSVNPVQNKVVTSAINQLSEQKVNKPTTGNGTAGQVLLTNGDGTTYWAYVGGGSGEDEIIEVDTVLDRTSSLFTVINGYVGGSSNILDNEAYKSYSMVATDGFKCYVEPVNDTTTYLSIAVWHDNVRDESHYVGRYRLTDGDLPTADAPLQIVPNDLIIISINNPDGYSTNARNFSLHTIRTQEVPKEESDKKCKKIRYVNEAGAESSTERLEIYIPASVGYVRYDFLHCIKEEINANIWRIGFAYAVDDDLNERFPITTSGEWEIAIKLSGRPDFSGGSTHGDVQMKDIVFFINGSVKDVTTFTELTEFESLRIVQTSDFYDPSSQQDKITENGIEYIFGDDDLLVNQSVLWKVAQSTQLASAYMAMHLPAKACTDTYYTDVNIAPTLIGDSLNIRVEGVRKAVVYGATSGVFTEFSYEKYPTDKEGGNVFLLTDNGGGAYNKCYYVVSDHTAWVKPEELWQSSVRYKFDIGK